MSNVTSIWQECKKNLALGLPSAFFIETQILGKSQLLHRFGAEIKDCNDEALVQIIRELTGMRHIAGRDFYPKSEVFRVLGEQFTESWINDEMPMSNECNFRAFTATDFIRGFTRKMSGSCYRVLLEPLEGDLGPVYTSYTMGHEHMISARGVLVFMMYLVTQYNAKPSERALRPCFILARAFIEAVLSKENGTVCPAGFQIPADCTSTQPAHEAEPQHTEPAKEEPKVQSEPEKPDDSKVVINMTPDLLTMMIKTAVNESVNAVWQKFMENREVLLHT